MPSRKQRRRAAKEKRHEYETVWVDAEGNELEQPPDELARDDADRRETKSAAKADSKSKPQQQRGGRAVRTPPEPSWRRAGRRSLLLGVVVFALFYLTSRKNGGSVYTIAGIAILYTALFIPFTYAIDRFAYTRYLRRAEGGGASGGSGKKPARKR
ncbi:MAG TPA: hypothetical protein VFJ91_11400 [Gaiellaceae bacterium]|nr:hypothetical protein [Gaiellaceae bacterium]